MLVWAIGAGEGLVAWRDDRLGFGVWVVVVWGELDGEGEGIIIGRC